MISRLALSTSSKQGSLAVFNDTALVYEKVWLKQNSHAEHTSVYIDEALKNLNLKISDIDGYICDIGPGSFTGVRVATSTIKTLAYANTKKILPVYSNTLLAAPLIKDKKPILTIINALRNQFYTAFYNNEDALPKPSLMNISEIENQIKGESILIGDGAEIFLKHCSSNTKKLLTSPSDLESPYPNIKWALNHSNSNKELNETIEWNLLEPLYIKDSSAEEKLQLGELKGAEYHSRRKPKQK